MTTAIRFLALPVGFIISLAAGLAAQPLSGAYTVGPAGNYANIGAARAALTTNGVSGPVSFTVLANDTGPWTFTSFPGQGPSNPVVFDGQGLVTLTGTQPLLTLTGCSDVTFRGFSASLLSTAVGILINAGTTNCVFSNCTILATVATSGSPVFSFAGGSGNRVEDSTFGGGYEAYLSAAGNDTLTIQRCRILGGGWWICENNGTNSVIKNNFFWGNTNYGIRGGSTATNLKIQHNSVYIVHTAGGGQFCSLRWYASNALNTEVQNNIFFDVYAPLTNTNFNFWSSSTTLRPTVMNSNVFWCPNASGGGTIPFFSGTNMTLAQWQATGLDLGSVQADPLYSGPTASPVDLRILSGSPAASAGTTLASITTDFFNSQRTPPSDIGAHELTSANLLTAITSGFGSGDLTLSLTAISTGATEGWTLATTNVSGPVGLGPNFGIRPTTLTVDIVNFPLFAGSPFHFPIGILGVYPDVPLILPVGALSFLAGIQMDLVAVVIDPGLTNIGSSNVVRIAW